MGASLQEVQYRMSREGFTCQTTEDGWEIEYTEIQQNFLGVDNVPKITKGNTYTEEVSFEKLPKNSDSEFVFGFAKCLAIERGWIS